MSLRSPLRQVLGLGAAKEGAHHWWSQRVTAIALTLLGAWFMVALLMLDSFDYVVVTSWIRNPYTATLLTVFVATLTYHSLLGVQVVIEDYIQGALKTASIVVSNFVHVLLGVAGVIAVLRVAFGSAA